MHASQASKFVKQFENVVDRATNIPKVKEIRFVGVEFDYKKVKIGESFVNKARAEVFLKFHLSKRNSLHELFLKPSQNRPIS